MLLTSVIVGGIGSLLTVALGAPLAARLSRVHVWRRTAPADIFESRVAASTRHFEPLDFGPDLVQWPSERAYRIPAFPQPGWPSETWDDPDFGRGKVARAADLEAKTEKRAQQERNRVADQKRATPLSREQEQKRKMDQQRQAKAKRAADDKRRANEKRQAEQQARRQAEQAQPAKKPQQRKPQQRKPQAPPKQTAKQRVQKSRPAPKPAPAPADANSQMPSKDELDAMIQSLGLAGTVQQLMRDNGWDFKTAAAWLARARKR